MKKGMTPQEASDISAGQFRAANVYLSSAELAQEKAKQAQQSALQHAREALDARAFINSELDLDRSKAARESKTNSEIREAQALAEVGHFAVTAADHENQAELIARGAAREHYQEYGAELHDAAVADAKSVGMHINVQGPNAASQEVPVNVPGPEQ